MVDTQTELARIDDAIALGRQQYLAAYFCGDDYDAKRYAGHVDELLDERNRVVRGPVTVNPDTLPTITATEAGA